MLNSIEELEALYGQPHDRAVRKQIAFLNEDYQAMEIGRASCRERVL